MTKVYGFYTETYSHSETLVVQKRCNKQGYDLVLFPSKNREVGNVINYKF